MSNIEEKLLSDKRVIAEIHRHLWIESEKAGHDIGFENAKEDWLKRFSRAWMEYHMPEELTRTQPTERKAAAKPATRAAGGKTKAASGNKRRRAKSYIKKK